MSDTLPRDEVIRALVNRHVPDAPESLIAALAGLDFGPGHNNPPPTLDPENLIDVDALPALLAENYSALTVRQAEIKGLVETWQAAHTTPNGIAIKDDADQSATSDIVQQIDTFASPRTGEVEEARKRVKRAPYEAGKRIDGFFAGLVDPIATLRSTITAAQDAYTRHKVAEARRIATEEAEARRKEVERERLAAEAAKPVEVGRMFSFDEPAAPEPLPPPPVAAPAPLTSSLGTTTFARGTWKAELVDIKILAQAVIDGKAPASFLAMNESVVGATVRGKNGIRECPGIRIWQEHTTARRS